MLITSISIFIIYEKNNTNTYKFISLGDGLSLGLNPQGIKSYNYNDYIKEYLKKHQKKINYFNYSEKNISIPELTNDIIYLKDKTLKEYIQTSNLIILSIGEKEIEENKSIKRIEEDLINLINEIKKYNSNICLLGRYNTNEEKQKKVKEVNNLYKQISKEYNVIFINIENNTYFKKNNINNYPTVKGYEKIGKMIIKVMNIENN